MSCHALHLLYMNIIGHLFGDRIEDFSSFVHLSGEHLFEVVEVFSGMRITVWRATKPEE
jgi:hypothetical protein